LAQVEMEELLERVLVAVILFLTPSHQMVVAAVIVDLLQLVDFLVVLVVAGSVVLQVEQEILQA